MPALPIIVYARHVEVHDARRYLIYMYMPKIYIKNVSTACTLGS